MLSPGDVILALKIAVGAVTVLLAASLVALAAGRPRLHGRINTVFFAPRRGDRPRVRGRDPRRFYPT